MAKLKTIRCSSLDALFSCPPSVLADGPGMLRIGSSSDAAELGKACHEMCANLVINGSYDLITTCTRYNFDQNTTEDAGKLMLYAVRVWNDLSQYFPTPMAETVLEGPVLTLSEAINYQLTGTCDLISPVGDNQAIFIDWKTGLIDDGFNHQMSGYAYLLWCKMGRPTGIEITGVVVFMRHRYYRVLKFTDKNLAQWEYDLTHNVLSNPEQYNPSKTCKFCTLFASCQARQAIMTGTISEIIGGTGTDGWWDKAKEVLAQITEDNKNEKIVGEVLSDVIFRIRLLNQVIDNAKSMIRSTIEKVGTIPLSDGVVLGLREVQIEKLNSMPAMKVLGSFMSTSQLADCMTISLPKVLDACCSKIPRGQKYDRRKEIHDKLVQANAVTVTTQKRLEEILIDENDEVKKSR